MLINFPPGVSDSPSQSCPFHLVFTTRHLILGYSGRRHTHQVDMLVPDDLLLGQATWLRCRVLDEPLAMPWCRNLACNTVMWRSRPGLRSDLWMREQMLVVFSLTLQLCTDRCRHPAYVLSFFFLQDLTLPSSEVATCD